jgi:hypothetical protein
MFGFQTAHAVLSAALSNQRMAFTTGDIIKGIVALLVFGSIAVFVVVRSIQKAEDPALVTFKWVLTAGVLFVMFHWAGPLMLNNPFVGVPSVAACGLVLAIIWGQNIGGLIAKPFTNLYDGGNVAPDPTPLYSVALARQKQARYLEAMDEVNKQLARFPTDVEGQFLLAQIQAEGLKDLPAAEMTIQNFCEQSGHAPQNIVFARYSMADWYLAIGHDPESARRQLELVIEALPGTELALGAAQRIAHLATPEMLLPPEERRKFIVTEGREQLGLVKSYERFQPKEKDPAEQAAEYVKHLEANPMDNEAREKLAVLYVDHYGRLDLATGELEQLIAEPNQPGRLVVHWLNLLADLQVRAGADYETVRQTLQRIIDRDPKLAAAEIARNRLGLLKLELKGKEKNRAVQLGSYEQNIGLKRGLSGR